MKEIPKDEASVSKTKVALENKSIVKRKKFLQHDERSEKSRLGISNEELWK